MTFSIVAYDPKEQSWGVGVASKFLAVGALVAWAQADAGAIATQALMRVSFGPDGLALLGAGKSAQQTLDILLANDPNPTPRQVGIVDAKGGSAAHTGPDCNDWKGHRLGEGFACQGNTLTGLEVLDAMVTTFKSAPGELGDRLLAALLAGDEAGGDRRGKQAAGLLVVKPGGSYGGTHDRYLDLRVDNHPDPVHQLRELVDLHHLYFGQTQPEDLIPITQPIASELQSIMIAEGYIAGEATGIWDAASKQAFWKLVGTENLEERWQIDGETDTIDRVALDYLRKQFS